jgi:hypothetical protein
MWTFTKKSGSATGARGVLSLLFNSKKIVILHENPWSSWVGTGVCVLNSTAVINEKTYNQMYKDMSDYADTVSSASGPTGDVYKNCIYLQDVEKSANIPVTKTAKLNNVYLGIGMEYMNASNGVFKNCWELVIGVNIFG